MSDTCLVCGGEGRHVGKCASAPPEDHHCTECDGNGYHTDDCPLNPIKSTFRDLASKLAQAASRSMFSVLPPQQTSICLTETELAHVLAVVADLAIMATELKVEPSLDELMAMLPK